MQNLNFINAAILAAKNNYMPVHAKFSVYATLNLNNKSVQVYAIALLGEYNEDEDEYTWEMELYFDTNTWDVSKDGLIYDVDEDEDFLEQVNELLLSLGWEYGEVMYTEQGMQSDEYVSLEWDN